MLLVTAYDVTVANPLRLGLTKKTAAEPVQPGHALKLEQKREYDLIW